MLELLLPRLHARYMAIRHPCTIQADDIDLNQIQNQNQWIDHGWFWVVIGWDGALGLVVFELHGRHG